jgi:hypothetical protein
MALKNGSWGGRDLSLKHKKRSLDEMRHVILLIVVAFVLVIAPETITATTHNVWITCQQPVPCNVSIDPNPVIVAPGDSVVWFVSMSCGPPCAFVSFTVVVPGLNYNSGAIAIPGTSDPTPAIPAPPPNTYPYTVTGQRQDLGSAVDIVIEGTIEVSEQIPTLSEWGMIILALLLLTAGTIAVIRRRKAVAARAN